MINRTNKIRNVITVLAFLVSLDAGAQSGRKFVREGNKLYNEKRFSDADSLFRRGMKEDSNSYKAVFNLGDALYKQGKYEEAAGYFGNIAQKNKDRMLQAGAYHNMGNCYLGSKQYLESINAYKKSLLLDPTSEDTRYNLAYAQMKLKKEEEQKNKDNKDKKDDKENKNDKDKKENKDNQDQKSKDEKEKKDNKENSKDDQDQKKQQQQKPQQLSKEDAQKILDALNNEEKKVQDKLKKKNAKGVKVQVEKDW